MRLLTGKMKRVLVLVMVLMLMTGSALASFDALIFSPQMKIYSSPSTSGTQIGYLKQGVSVEVEASVGEWAYIDYQGHKGFAKVSDMVSLATVKAKTNRVSPILYITKDDMTPRWGTLDRNTTVYMRSMNGDLYLVSDRDMNILAYIPKANVG